MAESVTPGDRRAAVPEDREASLPVWAQAKLEGLRRLYAAAMTELEAALLLRDAATSDTHLNPYGNRDLGTEPIGLGIRPLLAFLLPDPDPITTPVRQRVHAHISDDGQWLEIRSDHGHLIVRPVGANSVMVRWER